MFSRIVYAILILLIAAVLQILSGEIFAVWINFVFAALVAAAFFVNFLELLLLSLFAVLLLNWQPRISIELLVLAVLPLIVYKFRESFPWQSWLSTAIFVFAGITALYVIFAPAIFWHSPGIFFADAIGVMVFSQLAFFALGRVS